MGDQATTAILLVEDNPADIHLIQEALQDRGHDIHLSIVPNGRDALAFLRKEDVYALEPSPALILLDLSLPYLHGEVVLERLRAMPAYEDTPVVVFSGAPKEQEEQRCRRLGANAYVQKPDGVDGYFAAINTIVETWFEPRSVFQGNRAARSLCGVLLLHSMSWFFSKLATLLSGAPRRPLPTALRAREFPQRLSPGRGLLVKRKPYSRWASRSTSAGTRWRKKASGRGHWAKS